jgi:hypothetical protein
MAKVKLFLFLIHGAPGHEDVWEIGVISTILDLGARWK